MSLRHYLKEIVLLQLYTNYNNFQQLESATVIRLIKTNKDKQSWEIFTVPLDVIINLFILLSFIRFIFIIINVFILIINFTHVQNNKLNS